MEIITKGNDAYMRLLLYKKEKDGTRTPITIGSLTSYAVNLLSSTGFSHSVDASTDSSAKEGNGILLNLTNLKNGVYGIEVTAVLNTRNIAFRESEVLEVTELSKDANVAYDVYAGQSGNDLDMDFQYVTSAEIVGKNDYELWLDAGNTGTFNDFIKSLAMPADAKEKLATLWGIHFPTTMTVSDNGSTAELDKMKIVVFNTGDGTYPTTSITGSKVYKPYNGAETTTAIPASDLADGENCKTYQSASASGKSTYKFTDATSGKTGEITFRHYLPCYLWLSSDNTETDVNATNTLFNSANSVSDISKAFSENQTESKYIYVAVPIGWSVASVIAKSNFGSTKFSMKLAATTATHNIYVAESTILNTNGNTITAVGTGSIA